MQIFIAALHFIALAIGGASIFSRAILLKRATNSSDLKPVFMADAMWGLAAGLWLVSGLLRAFGGYEKGSDYYLHNGWFHLKLTLFVIVVIMEIKPMMTLIKWRKAVKSGADIDYALADRLGKRSHIQFGIIMLIIVAASFMARTTM